MFKIICSFFFFVGQTLISSVYQSDLTSNAFCLLPNYILRLFPLRLSSLQYVPYSHWLLEINEGFLLYCTHLLLTREVCILTHRLAGHTLNWIFLWSYLSFLPDWHTLLLHQNPVWADWTFSCPCTVYSYICATG